MKILGLQVEGIGKIKAMEMTFKESGLIPFVGKNNQGKTTILKCLEMLISGGTLPNDIINHDSKKGMIIATVGDYTVKRVVTKTGNRLEVSSNNSVLKSPQSFLDSLINTISFNPFSFINKNPKEKIKDMMAFSGIDFTDIDAKIKNAEQDRLVVGRLVKDYGIITPVEKHESVDIEDLEKEKKQIELKNRIEEKKAGDNFLKLKSEVMNHNETIRSKKQYLKICTEEHSNLSNQISQLEKDLKSKKISFEKSTIAVNEAEKALTGLVEKDIEDCKIENITYQSVALVETKISMAKEINEKVKLFEEFQEKLKSFNSKENEYQEIGHNIENLRKEKKAILKNAKLPIANLEIREDGIYFKNIYSENLSTSESMKLACGIFLSKNPKLKAITIDRGESYDAETLKGIETWAKENNMQCFITLVDSIPENKKDGVFYIEEGELC